MPPAVKEWMVSRQLASLRPGGSREKTVSDHSQGDITLWNTMSVISTTASARSSIFNVLC